MYKVKVENSCPCFIKRGLADVIEFQTQEEAQKEAQKLLNEMQTSFCRKHEFTLSEQFGDFTIYTRNRA